MKISFNFNFTSRLSIILFHQGSLLTHSLPRNIHLLTLEEWNGPNQILLRLEHLYEKDEDSELSTNVTVSLKVK